MFINAEKNHLDHEFQVHLYGGIFRPTCYNFEVLKAPSQIPPVFKQLKLDKTSNDRVVQSQVLNGWWFLVPAIFKVSYDELLPGFVVVWRAKKSELFRGTVVVIIVPNVSENQALHCFFTAKVNDETLLSSCLPVLCQPIVGIVSRPNVGIQS